MDFGIQGTRRCRLRRARYMEQRMASAVREVNRGASLHEVASRIGVSEEILFRWGRRCGDLHPSEELKIRELMSRQR